MARNMGGMTVLEKEGNMTVGGWGGNEGNIYGFRGRVRGGDG